MRWPGRLNSLGPGDLDSADRLAARAWLVARREDPRQEREALEGWLAVDPVATRALDRLAELAHRAGEGRRRGPAPPPRGGGQSRHRALPDLALGR